MIVEFKTESQIWEIEDVEESMIRPCENLAIHFNDKAVSLILTHEEEEWSVRLPIGTFLRKVLID